TNRLMHHSGDKPTVARLRAIPFNVSFYGREDPELMGKLMAEERGILNWFVQASVDWHSQGLPQSLDKAPSNVLRATTSWILEENNIKAWVIDMVDAMGSDAGESLMSSQEVFDD